VGVTVGETLRVGMPVVVSEAVLLGNEVGLVVIGSAAVGIMLDFLLFLKPRQNRLDALKSYRLARYSVNTGVLNR